MKVFMLKIIMDANSRDEYIQVELFRTKEGLLRFLKQWVYEQNQQIKEDPSDDIDEYFKTSNDQYEIKEVEVGE